VKIGLTFDLRSDYFMQGFDEEETAEFDGEDTIAGLEAALHNLGFETERIGNVKNLILSLASGMRWELVFNICEGMYGVGREAQVPAILDAYQIPYTFSGPMVLALALHKGMTKRVVRDMGIPTPEFVVAERAQDIENIDLPFPLFVKPVAEGTGKGISASSRVSNVAELRDTCVRVLEKYREPLLVETYLPGREFTAGIVGTGKNARVLGVMEVILKEGGEKYAYSYRNKQEYEKCVQYRPVDRDIAQACKAVALPVWQGLGCRDAGRIDLRMDGKGTVNFIEINPIAGLNETHSDLPILCRMNGISYQHLIEMIIKSVLERTGSVSSKK
jgi:D-alanine-D-alanine ligase